MHQQQYQQLQRLWKQRKGENETLIDSVKGELLTGTLMISLPFSLISLRLLSQRVREGLGRKGHSKGEKIENKPFVQGECGGCNNGVKDSNILFASHCELKLESLSFIRSFILQFIHPSQRLTRMSFGSLNV